MKRTASPLGRRLLAAALLLLVPALASGDFGPPHLATGNFLLPAGLAVDEVHGRVFVADTGHHVLKHTPLLGLSNNPAWTPLGAVMDPLLPQALHFPQGLAVDAAGHVYALDTQGAEVELYRYDAATDSYAWDGAFASVTRQVVAGVKLSLPRDIAVGPDGRVYLLDSGNNRVLVAEGPDDPDWEVWRQDATWGHPYGLDVGPDGAVYLADTDNHRVVRLPPVGPDEAFGTFGTLDGQLRSPRDVAVHPDGRMVVADQDNHRVSVLKADGSFDSTLGVAPLFGLPQKVEVDALGRVYVVDSQSHRLVAFLGADAPAPFDLFARDAAGDTGLEPSDAALLLASPDLLVRHAPDVDVAQAAALGLESYAFQQPRYNENNYVYVAVRNRGVQPATNAVARLYWADATGALDFPADWKTDGFYSSYTSPALNVPASTLPVSTVAGGGVRVVGPLVWRPPAPEKLGQKDGRAHLLLRLGHAHEPLPAGGGLASVRASNNVALRPAQVVRGPFGTGPQDTLVVRVDFPDVAGSADEALVTARVDDLDDWVREVSYGQAHLQPLVRGPVALSQPRAAYDTKEQSVLVELTTEVLEKLLAAEPGVLDGATSDAVDDVDRVILVLNDAAFTADWATTGPWPYTLGGQKRHLSVSVQGPDNDRATWAHGYAHQLGLGDVFLHENVEYPGPPVADGWDAMARPFTGVHPLVFSKEKASWVTASGGKVLYIPRPPYQAPLTGQPATPLHYQNLLQSGQYGALAVGLTWGVTTLAEETHFYVVEARTPAALDADAALPADGVLVYYANTQIPQGQAPVVVRDFNPATPGLEDAVVPVGKSLSPPGTGITVAVESKLAAGDGYAVRVDYDAPEDYDVLLRKGEVEWESPDLWVDNQRDGNGYAATPTPGEEQPIAGEDNRLYARVTNKGPGDAFDVEVRFLLSSPYHTVGGEADFALYKIVIIPSLPAGKSKDVYVVWKPQEKDDPHHCVQVQLRKLVSDTNAANNEAQQNVWVQPSSHASPYDKVSLGFQLRNAEPEPRLVYFQADGVPEKWSQSLSLPKALVRPGESVVGELVVQPHDEAPDCRDHRLHVTAWTPRGDTLVRLGGATLAVPLRQRTKLELSGAVGRCREGRDCQQLQVGGCTLPARANETLWVRYKSETGVPTYHAVTTGADGCYFDTLDVTQGGAWTQTVTYPGDKCSGPVQGTTTAVVDLPRTEDQDYDGLRDADEVQGDADGDGLPNPRDRDSDGDGLLDGEERRGDSDLDGLDDVVDPERRAR